METNLILYEQIDLENEIGMGAFATVYKGVLNGEEVAVKVLKKIDQGQVNFKEFRREVQLMRFENLSHLFQKTFLTLKKSGLEHPNLVQLKGVCKEPFCMVLEFMNGGNLFDFIHDQENLLPVSLQLSFALDIAKGMFFLHNASPEIIR